MSEATHHAVGASLLGWNRELKWLVAICLLVVALVGWTLFRGMGSTSTPGVMDTEVRIGCSVGTEGLIASIGSEYVSGLITAVDAANRRGGVHGRRIKLIIRNDSYEPLKCVLNTRDLIVKDSVFALTSYLGTPTCVKAQPIWTGARVPMVGMLSGASSLREPFNRYTFHVRASYREELHEVVNLFANQLYLKKVGILYQYDAFGQGVRRDARELLTQHGLEVVSEGSYPRNTLDVEGAVKSVLAGNPQAVFVIGTSAPLAKFIRLARAGANRPIYFAAASFVGGQGFLDAIGPDGEGCYVCHVMPVYENARVQVLADFQRDLAVDHPQAIASSAGLEGYINGRILIEGLERTGRRLTRERFIDALETIHGEPFGPGFEVSYGRKDHEGSTRVFMSVIRNGKYEHLDVKK